MGDVGGFNDGLYLVFSIFMTSYSAIAFQVDLLKNSILGNESNKVRAYKNSERYKYVVKKYKTKSNNDSTNTNNLDDQDQKLDMETVRIFAWILSKFTRIKTSMWISFKEAICCRKNARKMKARVR